MLEEPSQRFESVALFWQATQKAARQPLPPLQPPYPEEIKQDNEDEGFPLPNILAGAEIVRDDELDHVRAGAMPAGVMDIVLGIDNDRDEQHPLPAVSPNPVNVPVMYGPTPQNGGHKLQERPFLANPQTPASVAEPHTTNELQQTINYSHHDHYRNVACSFGLSLGNLV